MENTTQPKKKQKKSFNIEGLEESNQDIFEEILQSSQGSVTKALNRLCTLARQNEEKTAAEPERAIPPPNCGWAVFDEEFGDVCIFKLTEPVRRSRLSVRLLKYMDCEMCEFLKYKRQEQKVLEKQLDKAIRPVKLKQGAYEARTDILLIAFEYETKSPSRIAEKLRELKGVEVSPESITMWFKRHPKETERVDSYIAHRATMTPEEREREKKELIDVQQKKRFLLSGTTSIPDV